MAKRYPNPRLVKIHYSYTVEEVANRLGKHKNTVRNWIKKEGLPIIDDKRPALIQGKDLFDFLKSKREKNKRRCKPGELYCVRCRQPRTPAGNWAEYSPVTDKLGNLSAFCSKCESIMNRRVSLTRIPKIHGNLEVSFPEALRHINKMRKPSVNCDFGEGGSDYGKTQSGE